ncbi:hypothetical protein [Micromonospora chersina]|uniref:hypothetical protein n=1 Tax=Micromonospora chersina TaxID=47854 RepID=UPI0033AFB23A
MDDLAKLAIEVHQRVTEIAADEQPAVVEPVADAADRQARVAEADAAFLVGNGMAEGYMALFRAGALRSTAAFLRHRAR